MKFNQKLQKDFGKNIIISKDTVIVNCESIIKNIINKQLLRQSKQGGQCWKLTTKGKNLLKIETDNKGKKKENPFPEKWNLDPIFFGMWLGDGLKSTNSRNNMIKHLGFGNNEEGNIYYFLSTIKNLKQDVKQVKTNIQYGPFVQKSRIKSLRKILKSFGITDINFIKNKSNNLTEGANGLTAIFRISNPPLAAIFTYLYNNFNLIIKSASKEFKSKFLAGFFSAEGTVDKKSNKLQFATTDKKEVEILMQILNELDFRPLYTKKNNIIRIAYNKNVRYNDFIIFKNKILKHFPSITKKKEAQELIDGIRIRKHDIIYYSYFLLNPSSTINDLANNFQINRATASPMIYQFLKQGFLTRIGTGQGPDPFLYSPTKLGRKWFVKNLQDFRLILCELNRLNYYKKCFKKENIKNFNQLNQMKE